MPDFLRSYLATLTREQAIELSAWLVRDWKEKVPHYPLTAMVEVAGIALHSNCRNQLTESRSKQTAK